MKIKTKFISGFLILVVIPIAVVGVIGIYLSVSTLRSITIQHLELALSTKAETLEKFVSEMNDDVMFLKENIQLKGYLKSNRPEYLRSLEQDFLAFSKIRPQYYQMRYIDENGFERVRVDSDGSVSRIVPVEELQLKKDRYYFTQSISYRPGIVYVSPMDYNVERGKVEVPPINVIRFATSVDGDSGARRGIIIINLFANYLLDLVEKLEKIGGTAFLIDSGGRYISRLSSIEVKNLPDDEKGPDAEFHYHEKLEPSLVSKLISEQQGTIINADHIISYVPVYTRDVGSGFWILGFKYPIHTIFDSVTDLSFYLLSIGTAALILSISLGLYMSRRLARPILQLNKGVEQIGKKEFKHRVHIKTGDEIEDLADKFNLMASRLQDFHSRITHWNETLRQEVKRRTKELENSKSEVVKDRDKLKQQKNLIKSIINSLPYCLYVLDRDLCIVTYNRHMAQACLVCKCDSNDDCYNVNLLKLLLDGEWKQDLEREINNVFDTGDIRHLEQEVFCKEPDSERVVLRTTLFPILSEKGEVVDYVVWMAEDITEKKEIEARVIFSEKLAAIGQLTAGIAHEVNNPLGGIINCLYNLKRKRLSKNRKEEYLDFMDEGIKRVQNIVRQLLDFTQQHAPKLSLTDINTLIEDVIPLFHHAIKEKDIRFEKDLGQGLPSILVDKHLIEQVLVNLILNAVHAIDGNGLVEISTRREGKWYCIVVSDNGCGIPSENMPRIFDPFFTTKGVGKGTGLGLSVSHSIIERHRGRIEVKSKVGRGTVFKLYLPIAS